jgi:hypothetical protein
VSFGEGMLRGIRCLGEKSFGNGSKGGLVFFYANRTVCSKAYYINI